jgi:hypothetical protein
MRSFRHGGWRVASLTTPSRDSDYSDRWRVALPHATVVAPHIVASSDLAGYDGRACRARARAASRSGHPRAAVGAPSDGLYYRCCGTSGRRPIPHDVGCARSSLPRRLNACGHRRCPCGERSHPENVRRSYRVRGRFRGGKSVAGESNRGWSLMPVFGSTAPRTSST